MSKTPLSHPPLAPLGAIIFGVALSATHALGDETRLETVRVTDTNAIVIDTSPRYQPNVTKLGKMKQLAKDVPQADRKSVV